MPENSSAFTLPVVDQDIEQREKLENSQISGFADSKQFSARHAPQRPWYSGDTESQKAGSADSYADSEPGNQNQADGSNASSEPVKRTFSSLENGRARKRGPSDFVSSFFRLPPPRSRNDAEGDDDGRDDRSVRSRRSGLGINRSSLPTGWDQISGPRVWPKDIKCPTADLQEGDSDRREQEAEQPTLSRRNSLKIPLRPSLLRRPSRASYISEHVEDDSIRRKFLLLLAKALLTFGAPSHRIESQLTAAAEILDCEAQFVHIPNLVIASLGDKKKRQMQTHFVKANGRVALTSLHKVHLIYRDVLHDKIGVEKGAAALVKVLTEPALYPLIVRCLLAFVCSSIICVLAFGGSLIDMWVSGTCACVLQYLGLNAAAKSTMYANVYEISVSIIVSFIARALSTVPDNLFCYDAIASAGVVLILPGYTILISALELTSRNIFSGSVRLVYAIIYTLFLGFGLTIGSDFYLLISPYGRHEYEKSGRALLHPAKGFFTPWNGTKSMFPMAGTFGIESVAEVQDVLTGCVRHKSWPWWRKPLPFWTLFFLVPIYSTASSLSNLQSWKSRQLPIMVVFASTAYAVNKVANVFFPDRSDVVSAAGALTLGLLGNAHSRIIHGTAFTSMVTGVLFLVPSGIAQEGGLTEQYNTAAEQYSSGFSLALRMVQVAIGVTIGLFVSQVVVYSTGRRKNAAYFAF